MLRQRFFKSISWDGLLRMAADAIIINVSTLLALAARLLYIVAIGRPEAGIPYRQTFWQYLSVYGQNAWLLTLVCLVVFSLSGFYTFGRFYTGRYKLVVVSQAVSLAYLIFGLLTYLTQSPLMPFWKDTLNMPRGVLVISWLLTMSMMIMARAWTMIWARVHQKRPDKTAQMEQQGQQRILVIGGAGYIGSALLPHLLDRGYRVRLLDLLLYGEEPIEPYLDHPNLEVLRTDFRQIDKVVEATREVDTVIHLGGLVGDPACALDEQLTMDINLMATRMVAEVAKGSGVQRFVFASTCSVYGASDQMLNERSALNPVSLYASSKIASEKVLLNMADDHFAPTLLRFGTVYGLSGRTRFDLVINLLTAKALVDGEITIFGGNQWRPFVHVHDVARAIMAVLDAPLDLVRNQVFNVGSNEQNYTINQIGEIIHKHVPSAHIVNMGNDSDRRNYWVNFDKIEHTLGFRPEWDVDRGIDQVIDAIHSGKVKDYRDAKYSNVKFLTEEGLSRLIRHEYNWAQLLNEPGAEIAMAVE